MSCKIECASMDLICNPKSGRCVDPDGKIGRAIQGKSDMCSAKKQQQCKSEEKICNPRTHQCVIPHGKRGKVLLSRHNYVRKHDVSHVLEHIPNHVHQAVFGSKVPKEIQRDAQKIVSNVEQFTELYHDESDHLESNVKNGHKRGVLGRLFGAAKSSIMSMVNFFRRHPAFAVLLFSTLIFGTYVLAGPKIIQILGPFAGKIPNGQSVTAFVTEYKTWAIQTAGSIKQHNYMETINHFVTQLGALRSGMSQHLSKWYTLSIGAIQTAYGTFTRILGSMFGGGKYNYLKHIPFVSYFRSSGTPVSIPAHL